MKKRILLLTIVLLLGLLLTACQKGGDCAHQIVTSVEKEATCQSGGLLKHSCQLCGLNVTQEIPVGEHHISEILIQEATCATEGILLKKCDYCDSAEEIRTAAVAHQFDVYSLTPSRCIVCAETIADAANVPGNPWYGKNWVALGTSLSSQEQGTYLAPLAERTGLNPTVLGIPGGTANAEILQAVQNADLAQADLITIEFGVNDWFGDIPLGNPGDAAPYYAEVGEWNNGGTEEGSFAGACFQIFNTLQQRAPQAMIVFLTEPTGQAYSENNEDCSAQRPNHLGLLQMHYTETALSVARFMGIPTIDAGRTSMINQYHPLYLQDQIHHSALGGQQYALTVWMELKDMAPLLKAE